MHLNSLTYIPLSNLFTFRDDHVKKKNQKNNNNTPGNGPYVLSVNERGLAEYAPTPKTGGKGSKKQSKKQWTTNDNQWHTIYKCETKPGLLDNDNKTKPEKHGGVWLVRCEGQIVGYIIVSTTFTSGGGVLATLNAKKFDNDAKGAGDTALLGCAMSWTKAPPGTLPPAIEAKSKGLLTIGVREMVRILTTAGFLVFATIHPDHTKSVKVANNAGFRVVQSADGTRVRAEGEKKPKSAAPKPAKPSGAKIEKTYDLYIASAQ